MHRDLLQLKLDWASRDSFAGFLQYYPCNHPVTSEEFAVEFFELAQNRMDKHMEQWRSRNLPLVLGGDVIPATYIANWLLDRSIPNTLPITYYSDKHHTDINVQHCGTFLTATTTVNEHQ